jgi:hypothetical protein
MRSLKFNRKGAHLRRRRRVVAVPPQRRDERAEEGCLAHQLHAALDALFGEAPHDPHLGRVHRLGTFRTCSDPTKRRQAEESQQLGLHTG